MARKNLPWIEKYRPRTLDEVVGQEHVVNALKKYKDIRELPPILAIGPPGTGKTTVAYCLARHLGVEIVEHNASEERGIDTIRNKILDELSHPPAKIILLDEADALTDDAQTSLRRAIEQYMNTPNRLFLTANYPWRIIEPIQSRCAIFHFKPLKVKDVAKLLLNIMSREGMLEDLEEEEIKQILSYLIDLSKGDLRKAINALQHIHDSGAKLSLQAISDYFESNVLSRLLIRKVLEGAEWSEILTLLESILVEKGLSPKAVIEELYRVAIENIDDKYILAKFLRSLKYTDGFIAFAPNQCNILLQLASSLLDFYIIANTRKKE